MKRGARYSTATRLDLTLCMRVPDTALASAVVSALHVVTGVTVNTVHGNERTIESVRARCQPDVESMEGAAFMYSCLVAGVPFAQVRAVSNKVERRNRAAWKIDQAIAALGTVAVALLESA